MSCRSRSSEASSRATTRSWWRKVSTTSMASISSSSDVSAVDPGRDVVDASAIHQGIAFGCEPRQAALALLDRIADLLGVLGAQPAHLGDYLAGTFLEVAHGIHELADRVGPDRRPVTGPDRSLLHLVADLAQRFQALRYAFLHGFQRLGALMQAVQAGERSPE